MTLNNLENYSLSTNAPKNIKEFMVGLDFMFLSNLKNKRPDDEFLDWLIKNKGGIAAILKEVYWDKFDWESDKLFNIEELKRFLEDISEIWQEIFNTHHLPRQYWDSIIWVAGKYFFENEHVRTADIVLIESFFRYELIGKWINKTDDAQQREKEQSFYLDFHNDMKNLLSSVVSIVALDETTEEDEVIQLILLLMAQAKDFSCDNLRSFLEWLNNFSEEISKWNSNHFLTFVSDQIKESFPNIYSIEHTRYKVDIALISIQEWESIEPKIVQLLPSDHFYFKHDEDVESYEWDQFPNQWQIITSYKDRLYKNINIFNVAWKKVFWWDVSEDDIKNIKWTYYILTEGEGWRDVPEFAKWNVEDVLPVSDPYWEELRSNHNMEIDIPNNVSYILPEYMRLKAVWKIQNGRHIKNNAEIKL